MGKESGTAGICMGEALADLDISLRTGSAIRRKRGRREILDGSIPSADSPLAATSLHDNAVVLAKAGPVWDKLAIVILAKKTTNSTQVDHRPVAYPSDARWRVKYPRGHTAPVKYRLVPRAPMRLCQGFIRTSDAEDCARPPRIANRAKILPALSVFDTFEHSQYEASICCKCWLRCWTCLCN